MKIGLFLSRFCNISKQINFLNDSKMTQKRRKHEINLISALRRVNLARPRALPHRHVAEQGLEPLAKVLRPVLKPLDLVLRGRQHGLLALGHGFESLLDGRDLEPRLVRALALFFARLPHGELALAHGAPGGGELRALALDLDLQLLVAPVLDLL